MEKENIQLNLWNLMKHIWLSNCVNSFGPGFKTRALERNELTESGFETMTVCSDLVVLTYSHSIEGPFLLPVFYCFVSLLVLLFGWFKGVKCAFKKTRETSKFCRIPSGYQKTQYLVKPRVYYTVHKEKPRDKALFWAKIRPQLCKVCLRTGIFEVE
jgi:hypothetical protein